MEPRIGYAATSDGASIAFWTLGEGETLVQMPTVPFTHIQMEWADPDWRRWYEALGQGFRLVRYDARGCGMSGRSALTYTREAMLADLVAVVDRLQSRRFALLAPVQAGPAAIAFAARYPERVSRLVLWCAISHADEMRTSSFEALRAMSHADWGLFAEAAAHALIAGWDQAAAAHRMAAIMREACTAEIHDAVLENYLSEDLSPEYAGVQCPVLVAFRMQGTAPLPVSARFLAASLRDSTLLPFPGTSLLFHADVPEISAAFHRFLQPGSQDAAPASRGSFQTLLYTDIEGHTAIIQSLGDERGRVVLREHERVTRIAIQRHGGTEVLATGDGFLVRFDSAYGALACAAGLQRDLADASLELPVELRVRIGITAGEPIVEGDELHGASVLSARSIAAQAIGGKVVVANVVRELAAGKGFAFQDLGDASINGLSEPVRLWELIWAHVAT
jgi:class 3 adenylate cyclase/pimeloyl-ACP methyl ester carboxylesterase